MFQVSEMQKLYPNNIYTSNAYYTTLFVLNDPMDLELFEKEADTFLPEYYEVESIGSYDQVAAPMKSMQGIATLILYGAVGAAIITISLLITLFLRDRKHEIGIYLSLGEKKSKIARQIVLEVTVVAIIAITLSLFTGNLLSGIVSEKMLTDQIVADQKRMDSFVNYTSEWSSRGYDSGINSDDLLAIYGVSLDKTTVFLFYLVGIGTVFVSTLIPIIYITRLNPKKILMG
jgi:putative ABC transport system permease protein